MRDEKLASIAVALAAAAALAACGKSNEQSQAPKTTAVQQPVVAEAPPPPPPPARPTHNYSMEEDGEYGYEPAVSEDERRSGRTANSLLMVRYLGEKDGTHSVSITDGAVTNVFSCKAPCEFIKGQVKLRGQVVKTETMRNPGTAVISAVMADAMNGELKPYKPAKN
ncbi:hypothetical protein BKK79_35925 [Cupriavidus sp. USMAA2-4]|uniref:hypothetical protein n=1 Tax=Cupriavidus sp. USMAA2-4 TaxID=876364 RepID=UPI0008A68932|nr:hypothetical protein [Cupriavidus sp. USMAA2-4]AOY96884.1 hypothetical protein BKK79_35925 [Cupriavidus sp. USMAA2-4]